jgi:hypothetical protein
MPGSALFPDDPSIYELRTRAPGPAGALPLTENLLRTSPSGDIFGLTQNVRASKQPQRSDITTQNAPRCDACVLVVRALLYRFRTVGKGGGVGRTPNPPNPKAAQQRRTKRCCRSPLPAPI